jgi:hypothetical protein
MNGLQILEKQIAKVSGLVDIHKSVVSEASGVFVAQKLARLLFLPLVKKEIVMSMISEERQQKHGGGRPKKLVKKESVTGIRFTKLEYYLVKRKATKSGIGITSYIRQMALQGKIIQRMNEEERQFVRQLTGMANNLNQLAKIAHEGRMMTAFYSDDVDHLFR